MLGSVHAFEFLEKADSADELPPLIALFGDEPFLKQLTVARIKQLLSGDESPIPSWDSNEARWADVSDELLTPSLFGSGNNGVVLRQADPFVTANRSKLEEYVDRNRPGATLVLEVKTWPGNTRLAKKAKEFGLAVACRAPQRKSGKYSTLDRKRMVKWVKDHAAEAHRCKLTLNQAESVFELVGENMGLIDGELAKLALFTDDKQKLSDQQITDVVGGWRTQSTWDLLDKICQGDAADAISQLDRLIQSGDHPQALFGAFSWSLRRYAAAVRVVEQQESSGQKPSLPKALATVGVKEYPRERFESAVLQLRQIGRARAARLYQTLLNADLKMKRSHSQGTRARLVLEQMIFELSKALKKTA